MIDSLGAYVFRSASQSPIFATIKHPSENIVTVTVVPPSVFLSVSLNCFIN